jgi:RNA polymerase sigma factor (sigma-70 family)
MTARSFASVLHHLRTLAETHITESQADGQLLTHYVTHKDEGAFAALVSRHGPMVWGVCQRVLHHGPDADDAFQATFLLLTRKAAYIRKRESVGSWLHGAAYRIAAKARSATARRQEQERRACETHPKAVGFEAAWLELQGVLDEELQCLPKKQRAALLLCYLEGRTHEEAARHLGWPVGTVKSTLARARERLRLRLTRRGLALSASGFAAVLAVNTASAAVPALCRQAVLQIAKQVSTSGAATVSSKIAAMAQAGAKSFLAAKFKIGLALTVACSLVGMGAAALAPLRAPEETLPGVPTVVAKAHDIKDDGQDRKDRFGDPLPPGALARMGTIRFRVAGSGQRSVAFTPHGKGIITAGHGSPTRLWETSTGKLVRQFDDKSRGNHVIALSSDGRMLAGRGGSDGSLRLWEIATGKLLAEGRGEPADPVCLAFSPNGKMVASAGADNKLRLWDAGSGEVRWIENSGVTGVGRISAITFDPDNKTLATLDEHGLSLWDAATGERASRRYNQEGRPSCAAFFPDGRTLAVARGPLPGAKEADYAVCLIDVATLKEVRQLAPEKDAGFADVFQALAVAPDGKILATANGSGQVRLWDTATGKEMCQCQGGRIFTDALAFSPAGKKIAGIDKGLVRQWDAASGKDVTPSQGGHRDSVSSLAFTPDGAILVSSSSDGSVRQWDSATGEQRQQISSADAVLKEYELTPMASALAPDGKSITTVDLAWPMKRRFVLVIRTWDRHTTKELTRASKELGYSLLGDLALSPDGKTVACHPGDDGPKDLHLWEAATGKLLSTIAGANPAFSPDGSRVATSLSSAMGHSSVTIWEAATGKSLGFVEGVDGDVYRLSFCPDGKALAIVGNVGTRNAIQLLPLLKDQASKSGLSLGAPRMLAKELPYRVEALAFSPDGWTFALSDEGGTVRLLEKVTGKERAHFVGHAGPVRSLSFSPDGRRLASGNSDSTILVWDVTGRLQAGKLRPKPLSEKEQEDHWADLATDEAERAGRAIWALAASPGQALPLLAKHLRRAAIPVDSEVLAKLIRDLDDDAFDVRVKAFDELKKIGEIAEPALRQTLEQAPSLEVRKRVEELLATVETQRRHPAGEALRNLRAIEVLEQIGDAEARKVLKDLAAGASGSSLKQEAKSTLDRLDSVKRR